MAFDSFPDPDDKEAVVRAVRTKERRQIQTLLGALAGTALAALLFWPRTHPPKPEPQEPPPPAHPSPTPPASIRSVSVNTAAGIVKVTLRTGNRPLRHISVRCEVRWAGAVEEFHVREVRGVDHHGGRVPARYTEVLTFHFATRVVPQNVRCFTK